MNHRRQRWTGGMPEDAARVKESYTGAYLRGVLGGIVERRASARRRGDFPKQID